MNCFEIYGSVMHFFDSANFFPLKCVVAALKLSGAVPRWRGAEVARCCGAADAMAQNSQKTARGCGGAKI